MICVLPHPLEKLVTNKCLDSDLGFSHLLHPLILILYSAYDPVLNIQPSQMQWLYEVCVCVRERHFFKAHSKVSSLKAGSGTAHAVMDG